MAIVLYQSKIVQILISYETPTHNPLPHSNNVFVAVGMDPLLNGHEVKDIS